MTQIQNEDCFSPLRYPGSKKRFAEYLLKILEENKVKKGVFVEPFVGGGSVFLKLLSNNVIEYAIISDIDRLVCGFWHSVFCFTEEMIEFVKNVSIDVDNFKKYKNLSADESINDNLELGKACLFLNRTSFSGILKHSTGPIGGSSQTSKYPIDCRFNRESLIRNIKKVSKYRDRVTVMRCDWEDTIQYVDELVANIQEKADFLFYFDPPFYKRGKSLYRYYFNDTDHVKLRDKLIELNYNWILSYDCASRIKEIYSNFAHIYLSAIYSLNTNSAMRKSELLISNLILPV